MFLGIEWSVWLLGLGIFVARVADVSAGTMRTIAIVSGRTLTAFFLGLIEISVWLVVISAVITQIADEPLLGVFYALGFSVGNVAGIKLEKHLALGHVTILTISPQSSLAMAQALRAAGYAATTFTGQGKDGPVIGLLLACRRRDAQKAIDIITDLDPDAFYVADQASHVSKVYGPLVPSTGWRAVLKKK